MRYFSIFTDSSYKATKCGILAKNLQIVHIRQQNKVLEQRIYR